MKTNRHDVDVSVRDVPLGRPVSRWLDDFGRRHPWLMFFTVIVLACTVTVLLLARTEGAVVLYQRF